MHDNSEDSYTDIPVKVLSEDTNFETHCKAVVIVILCRRRRPRLIQSQIRLSMLRPKRLALLATQITAVTNVENSYDRLDH